MVQWARKKNREHRQLVTAPAMIVGAFIIDLLLALTLFIGRMLGDNFHAEVRLSLFSKACS